MVTIQILSKRGPPKSRIFLKNQDLTTKKPWKKQPSHMAWWPFAQNEENQPEIPSCQHSFIYQSPKTGKHQIVKTQNPEPLRLRIAEK
jgi:hypothetical protein